MTGSIGERLRKFRETQGFSIDQLAAKSSVTSGHIGRIERGDSSNPRFETIEALARALNIDPADIMFNRNREGHAVPDRAFDAPAYIPNDIPVVGLTKAGRGGFFNEMGYPSGEGFKKVHRPIDVKDPNAYALVVEGDSMSPMLEQGWIVYVCPNHTYGPGDLVVVGRKNDEIMIKKFRHKDGMVLLQSINPTYEPLMISPDEIHFMHKVCLIKPR